MHRNLLKRYLHFIGLFCLSSFGVVCCLCLDSWNTLQYVILHPEAAQLDSTMCVLYFYFNAVSFGGVYSRYFTAILVSIPFSAVYSIEENNNFVVYKVVRLGKKKYNLYNIGFAAASAGAVMLIGRILFPCVLSIFLPIATPTFIESMNGLPFHELLQTDNVTGYFAVLSYLALLKGIILGSIGMCVSAFLPNAYIAICSPMLFEFLMVEINRLLMLPSSFRLDMIFCGRGIFISNNLTLVVSTVATILVVTFCYKIFGNRVERRIENGE